MIFCIRYSRSFQVYFQKHQKVTNKSLYVNQIENRIAFRIKTGYYLHILTTETIKFLGSAKNKIANNEHGENVPRLKITGVVLTHRNIVNNDNHKVSRALYTFVSNKWFDQLLDISPKTYIFLRTINSEISYTEVSFVDQSC